MPMPNTRPLRVRRREARAARMRRDLFVYLSGPLTAAASDDNVAAGMRRSRRSSSAPTARDRAHDPEPALEGA